MPSKVLIFLIILATTANLANQSSLSTDENAIKDDSNVPKIRNKRGLFWDFFQKIVTTKNLVVDQYTDTRDTFSEVFNLVNEGFSDPAPAKPTNRPGVVSSTTPSSEEDGETTTEPYRISRYELGRIFGRNFRGLQRLMKIELQDAFNQSQYNLQEYKAEANKQFANSLAIEKKNQLKRLKG